MHEFLLSVQNINFFTRISLVLRVLHGRIRIAGARAQKKREWELGKEQVMWWIPSPNSSCHMSCQWHVEALIAVMMHG
jgi:hypothetical protein